MARPKKKTEDKRACVLPPLRCTASERAAIEARASEAGLSLSDYMRQIALNGHIIVKDSLFDRRGLREINAVGVNINQLARHANMTGELDIPELRSVSNLLNDILDRLVS